MGVLSFIGGILFWVTFYQLDQDEEALNNIESGDFLGQGQKEKEKA